MNEKDLLPLVYTELSVVIYSTSEINELFLTTDLLKSKDIIPKDWEIYKTEVENKTTKISFTNSVTINQVNNLLAFAESFDKNILETSVIPSVINKYLDTFSSLEFKGLEIRPTSYFRYDLNEEQKESAQPYIFHNLLPFHKLKNYGKKPITGNVNLTYILDNCSLNIEIQDMIFSSSDNNPETSSLFIYGNFSYEIENIEKTKREKILTNLWKENIKIYQEIVDSITKS